MTLYTDEARVRAEAAEPEKGAAPLALLAHTVARVARVAGHYGLSPEHAEALTIPGSTQALRDKLAADMAAFEARGGHVAVIAPGVSGRVEPDETEGHIWTRLELGRPRYG